MGRGRWLWRCLIGEGLKGKRVKGEGLRGRTRGKLIREGKGEGLIGERGRIKGTVKMGRVKGKRGRKRGSVSGMGKG